MRRLSTIFGSLLVVSAFLFGAVSASAQKVGKVGKKLPAWEAGYLDIHFINTCTG